MTDYKRQKGKTYTVFSWRLETGISGFMYHNNKLLKINNINQSFLTQKKMSYILTEDRLYLHAKYRTILPEMSYIFSGIQNELFTTEKSKPATPIKTAQT